MPRRVFWPAVLTIAAIKFAIALYASGFYDYFRDELYFIACGRHLDWGYVDHPPLVAIYAWIGERLGGSLRGFRLLATIAGTLRIVLTGILTARLGGNRTAQTLACITVLLTPCYLAVDSILTMNVFEQVIWLGCILAVVEIANGGSEKWWLAFGVLAGIGLQNKHSMLFFGFALALALLLTPMRRSLAKPWIWIGGAIALLIFLPNVIWEVQHDYATLELLRNVKETGKNVVLGPVDFVIQQAMMLNPFFAPLWIAGLVFLFLQPRYRVLAWTYVIVLLLFIKLEAKDYYLAPLYPTLFAAGAVWLSARRYLWIPMLALIVVGGLISAPLVLPIFTPEKYLAYQRALGVEQRPAEVSHTSEMPQIFSDQFGWREMVREVARVYHALPPDVRAKTAIWCGNYGEAGAIDFYGPRYGLPPAISGHQSYYLWGPRDYTGESMIVIASRIVRTRPLYSRIETVGQRFHPHAMPDENGPVFLCTTKRPLREIWHHYKNWR
jgi:4-amino-4-deoxy-L-arabinose transferase-like glycosyltransferase